MYLWCACVSVHLSVCLSVCLSAVSAAQPVLWPVLHCQLTISSHMENVVDLLHRL